MAKIRLSFENFHASQGHFYRLFPYNSKISPTLHNSPSCVQLIQHLMTDLGLFVLNVICCYRFSHSPLPLKVALTFIVLVFWCLRCFSFLVPPYCIWGDKGTKSEKNRDKMHFLEYQPLLFAKSRKQNKKILDKYLLQLLCVVRSLMRILATKKVLPIFVFWDASSKNASRVCAHAHPTAISFFLLSQVSQRAKNWSSIRSPYKVLFCKKRRVTFRKTTGHFS